MALWWIMECRGCVRVNNKDRYANLHAKSMHPSLSYMNTSHGSLSSEDSVSGVSTTSTTSTPVRSLVYSAPNVPLPTTINVDQQFFISNNNNNISTKSPSRHHFKSSNLPFDSSANTSPVTVKSRKMKSRSNPLNTTQYLGASIVDQDYVDVRGANSVYGSVEFSGLDMIDDGFVLL